MSWRSVIISNPAKLSISSNQLVVAQEEKVSVPLEDIGVIVIESAEVNLTTRFLEGAAKHNVVVYVCDDKHLPCGVFSSFGQHSRHYKVLKKQLEITLPFKKRCWQNVVKQKIYNQSLCLRYAGKQGAEELLEIYDRVQSGDSTNREAQAAKIYFNRLFGKFNRKSEGTINSALNYGYSIVRGAIARSIVSYGFIPSIGIHHCNELNNFNLADDFLEPFRPLVDLWVATNLSSEDNFGSKERMKLVNLLHSDIEIRRENYSVISAIDQIIASFSSACFSSDCKILKAPTLVPIEEHHYE